MGGREKEEEGGKERERGRGGEKEGEKERGREEGGRVGRIGGR